MKYLRKSLIGLGVLLLFAVALLWFLPARWAMPWIAPSLHGVHLQQVHGSLWRGDASAVMAADGRPLGQLHWQLSRRALLEQLRVQLDLDGPQLDFSGAMQRLADGRVEWRATNLHLDLAMLESYVDTPWGQPHGELQVMIDRAVLQGGWPLQLQGKARWQHAVMRTRDGEIALGELQLQAQAQGGVIQARMTDDGGGPLRVDGQMQLSPLGWRLDATLQPRQTDPALGRWLATLGQSAADGSVHIQRHGGLTVGMPPTH